MEKLPSHLVPSRSAKRAHYDQDSIYSILDEALFCKMSFSLEDRPFSIPTSFVRHEDKIYVHGSVGSHFIREMQKGISVCISVMLTDALVVAKSAFSHSVNYRSVVLFAQAETISDSDRKIESFMWLTNKIVTDSWDYLRPVTASEVKKTAVLAFSLDEASAKIRRGMPNDEPEDKDLPIWSGLIPLVCKRGVPQADESSVSISLPVHLKAIEN